MWVCLFQVPAPVKWAPVTCVPLMILSTSQAPLDILGYFALTPSLQSFGFYLHCSFELQAHPLNPVILTVHGQSTAWHRV